MNEVHQSIIQNYIHAYNSYDVDGMLRDLHPDIIFENITGGQVTHRTEEIEDFKAQATAALEYFENRKQSPLEWFKKGDSILVKISYAAVLAVDFPNGMKKGDQIELSGHSEFWFKNNQIIKIVDQS